MTFHDIYRSVDLNRVRNLSNVSRSILGINITEALFKCQHRASSNTTSFVSRLLDILGGPALAVKVLSAPNLI